MKSSKIREARKRQFNDDWVIIVIPAIITKEKHLLHFMYLKVPIFIHTELFR